MSVASVAADAQQAPYDDHERLKQAILAAVADDTAIVGAISTLARGFAVTASELKTGLRELLEARQITVHAGTGKRLTIRRERRASTYLAPLPPATERRKQPYADVWVV